MPTATVGPRELGAIKNYLKILHSAFRDEVKRSSTGSVPQIPRGRVSEQFPCDMTACIYTASSVDCAKAETGPPQR